MNTGIPLEIMYGEGRVALIPAACARLTAAGHSVYLETGAGLGSGYSDQDYVDAGVEVVKKKAELFEAAQLIVKVKQPLEEGLKYLTREHTVFSFLHLAAQPVLTRQLCHIGLTAIAFESVVDDQGARPLLAPMSKIAGRLAVIGGAGYLFQNNGGKGILLGGIDSADNGKVVVMGAGVAGEHAVEAASSIGASVTVFDLQQSRLEQFASRYRNCTGVLSDEQTVAAAVSQADLVVSAVMVAGRRAPVVISEDMVRRMAAGSVIVDIAIDQGGSIENIHATSYEQPIYTRHGVLHQAVPNMPGAVPRTASQALSAAVLPYVVELLEKGIADSGLEAAAAVHDGAVVDAVLKEELGL
ncbi:MAG: alanine dehydrogenase [Thiotrichales bacterium]|nr:MAG: alanine dehydrogenase [Thiotrichales bacterium]